MRYCVTGAGGYLGRGVVAALLDCGEEVIAVDRSLEGVDSRATALEADVLSLEEPYRELGKPEAVLHLAWRNGFKHNDPSHIGELDGHCRFIEALAASPIDRFAVMGSMHETGYHEGAVRADTPCFPLSRYGVAKNALRDFSFMVAREHNVPCQWLRGFYIVDGDPRGSSIFAKLSASALAGEEVFPFTSGKSEYDFLDYDEFCIKVAAAVTQSRYDGIINICSGKHEPLKTRVERFISEHGYRIELDYGAYPDRPYDSPAIWGDSTIIDEIVRTRSGQ